MPLHLQAQLFIMIAQIGLNPRTQLLVLFFFQTGILREQAAHLLGGPLKDIRVCENIRKPEFQVAALAKSKDIAGPAKPKILRGNKKAVIRFI